MMRKVSVVVTARASYGRVRSVLEAIVAHPRLVLQLILFVDPEHNNTAYLPVWIREDGYDIDAIVKTDMLGNDPESAAARTGHALVQLTTVFRELMPDVVLTVADRHETLATAVAASYMNIPLAHLQGGEVTGNIDDKVRYAVTALADIHFVATRNARTRLLKMGEAPERVYLVGCPSIDLAKQIAARRGHGDPSRVQQNTLAIPTEKFLIVMQHPVTTEFGDALIQIRQTLEAVRLLNIPALWFQPNYDPGHSDLTTAIMDYVRDHPSMQIIITEDMPPAAFLDLLARCTCLIGNSSAGIREGSFLGIPVVNIGTRQAGRERSANVVDVDYDAAAIYSAVLRQLQAGKHTPDFLYGQGNAAIQIADHLANDTLSITKKLTIQNE